VKLYTLLSNKGLAVRNDSDHVVTWGGFQLHPGEYVHVDAHWANNWTLNMGHWKTIQEELDIVCKVHEKRRMVEERD